MTNNSRKKKMSRTSLLKPVSLFFFRGGGGSGRGEKGPNVQLKEINYVVMLLDDFLSTDSAGQIKGLYGLVGMRGGKLSLCK